MSRFCLACARICSAMWIGAALLFVLTSVTEQLEPALDAATKDRLALIRFPWYYGTGAVLLTSAFVAALPAGRKRVAVRSAAIALFLAGCVMIADYALVYRPLRARLSPAGAERSAEFRELHEWSERLNSLGFLLSATAAVLLHVSGHVSHKNNE